MGSMWLVLRAGSRRRLRAWLALSLLLGVIGGGVIGAAAGAQRTDTAYPRLRQWSNAADFSVIGGTGNGYRGYFRALAGLPQVGDLALTEPLNMVLPGRGLRLRNQVQAVTSPDGGAGLRVDRVKVLAGRMFGRQSAGEAVVDQQLARRAHVRPGSVLRLVGIPTLPNGQPDFRHAMPLTFHVSAIVVFDFQIVPATGAERMPTVLLSPSFSRSAAAAEINYGVAAQVRLRQGASASAFVRQAHALAGRFVRTNPPYVVPLAGEATATQRAIRPQALALATFAAMAALIGLAVMAQILSRQITLDSAEYPILRALGTSRLRLAVVTLARVSAVTIPGALLATAIAVACSPVMPIGPARLAEPSPGLDWNWPILAAGFALIALVPLLLLGPSAWRAAGRAGGPLGVAEPAAPSRRSRLGSALGLAGSVTGGLAARMAFEPGHGRTAVPVRSALAGTAVAVASVVAATVFGASLIHLVRTPARYGQDWTATLDLQFGGVPQQMVEQLMATQPDVAAYAAGDYGQVEVAGSMLPAIGIDPLRGAGWYSLLSGRAPRGPGEITLGAKTLASLRLRLGDTTPVTVNGRTSRMRVVGTAVFASFSRGTFTPTGLGAGAAVAASVLSTPSPQSGCVHAGTCYNFVLMRYRPGADPSAAAARIGAITARLGCPVGSCLVSTDQRPSDIRQYSAVRDTPLALAALLALLALATLAHVLVSAVRRRRRDLATLKTLGLLRGQMLGVVAGQATLLATVALAIGAPLGVATGRWSWVLLARAAGVASDPVVPVAILLAAAPAALVAAILLALGPGWAAARVRPAAVLRSE